MADLMIYKKLRPGIQTGDMLAFRGKGFFSRAIQLRSHYSHVAMLVWVTFYTERRLMIAHAVYPTGVVYVNASEYIKRYQGQIDLYTANHEWFEETASNYQGQIADFMAVNSGYGYDMGGVFKFVLPFFKNSASAYFCSEVARASVKSLGFDVKVRVTPEEAVQPPLYVKRTTLD